MNQQDSVGPENQKTQISPSSEGVEGKQTTRFYVVFDCRSNGTTLKTIGLVSDEHLINSFQMSQISQEVVEFIFDFAVLATVTVLPIIPPFGGNFQSFMTHI